MSEKKQLNSGRIGWLEREGTDFPYYVGVPVGLSGLQWIAVLIGVAAGFYVLVNGLGPIPTLRGFVPTILYVAIPLFVLAIVSKGEWTALFRKVSGRDVLLMIGFAILNIIVTLVAGTLFIDEVSIEVIEN